MPRRPPGSATRPSREDNNAVMGEPGGPYGKTSTPEMRVKKAEKALRLFYFDKKEVRFFKNKMYIMIYPPYFPVTTGSEPLRLGNTDYEYIKTGNDYIKNAHR